MTTGCTYFKHFRSHEGNQEKSANKLEWGKKKPERRQELTYESRGSFDPRLEMEEEEVWVVIRSGEYPMGMFLKIPAASIGDIQGKLEAA